MQLENQRNLFYWRELCSELPPGEDRMVGFENVPLILQEGG